MARQKQLIMLMPKQKEGTMPSEFSRKQLLVQLKILKELRILNKNIRAIVRDKVGRNDAYKHLESHELEDVKDAIAETGYMFI